MSQTPQKYTFHVHGMHCNACVLLTEQTLGSLPNVHDVKAHLKNHSVDIVGTFEGKSPKEIAEELTAPLLSHGYTVSVEQQIHAPQWQDFRTAVPIALAFIAVFIALQNMGIVNLVSGGEVTYGTAFVIGVIASLSTCMAVVGGLLLSMSATFAKEGSQVKPQLMFHAGRILSFFILGGVIGALGSAFTLNTTATVTLNVIIAIVMLMLGINLLDIFHGAKKWQPTVPKCIARRAHGVATLNHTLTPLLVGVATFFLPCGFTQSMQLYALSTGSFMSGGLTMLVFALGTLPVLALISFSSFSIAKNAQSGIFFKSAGLIVILFAVFNLINSLVILGVIPPIFNF